MRRLAAGLAVCLTTGLALVLSAPTPAAAVAGKPPFSGPRIAAADSGETVVVWNAPQGVQAAIGTPGGGYGAPVTITPNGTDPAVVMDAAGNAVFVWEEGRSDDDCYKGSCGYYSLGVFAAIRPAGGEFGAPVRLTGRGPLARPRVVMNRAGDWVVTLSLGSTLVVGAGTGTIPPSSFAVLPAPGFQDGYGDVAIDEAGNTTFGLRDQANRPAVVTRARDGSFGPITVLDATPMEAYELAIGVGAQGHAVAVWRGAGGVLRSAARPPGGSFGAPVSLGVAGVGPESIGVDGQGRTTMALYPGTSLLTRLPLQVRRGTVAAPFGDPQDLGRVSGGPVRLAIDGAGHAVLGWLETARSASPVALAAIAGDGGPLSKPFVLSRAASVPDVAIDGAGRAVLAWTDIAGDVQRLLVAAVAAAAAAVAGPTVVAQGRLIIAPPPPVLQGRASASPRQVLRIRPDGTIRPMLRCQSPRPSCRATLRIDVRPAPGRKRIRAGTHRFVFKAGRSQRVAVRVTRAARRAAARRSLKGTISVRTTVQAGGSIKDVATVTLRRRSS